MTPSAEPGSPSAMLGGRRRWVTRVALAGAGVVFALLSLEVALRLFATPNAAPRPHILADGFDQPAVTHRQLDEGISVAHYSDAGARLTGNAFLVNAPTIVVLGDSYVVAREVNDRETMGSWLERMARSSGIAVNVRQYGWSRASPAQYIIAAPQVIARWNPARVVIAIPENDIDINALYAYPTLRVGADGNAEIVGSVAEDVAPVSSRRSTLRMLFDLRWFHLRRQLSFARHRAATNDDTNLAVSPSDAKTLPDLPAAVVRALAAAYGDRLVLVYLAVVGLKGGVEATGPEQRFLAECVARRVTCASTRSAMVAGRSAGVIAHGFSTTSLGYGHLNGRGLEMVALTAWPLVQPELRRITAGRH